VKQNKTISLEIDIFNFLKSQPNSSRYIEDLILADMRRINNKKTKEVIDISKLHEQNITEDIEKNRVELERKARSHAWDNLDLEVKEEIKDLDDWGIKWKTIFYPMYLSKKELTLKDVRDWYFANKEGFKV
jgi:hypothetical protein